jgi:hypothetical protein
LVADLIEPGRQAPVHDDRKLARESFGMFASKRGVQVEGGNLCVSSPRSTQEAQHRSSWSFTA